MLFNYNSLQALHHDNYRCMDTGVADRTTYQVMSDVQRQQYNLVGSFVTKNKVLADIYF
jgi:hypothetical protein